MTYITADPEIRFMEFFGNINKPLKGHENQIVTGDIHGKVFHSHRDRFEFVYKEKHQELTPMEYTICYWLLVKRGLVNHRRINLRFKVVNKIKYIQAYHF